MIGLRTIGTFAVILAFGLGFSAVVDAAHDMRTEQLVNHEIRLVG